MHMSNEKDRDELRKKPYKLGQKGRQKAYEVLVLQYQDRLVFSVYKFLKDYELAQDIAQEAFVKAFKNIEKFRGDSPSIPGFIELL